MLDCCRFILVLVAHFWYRERSLWRYDKRGMR